MKSIGAREAVKGFSQLMDDAQQEPVTVERNGRPVAVVYSYAEAQKMEALKEAEFKRFVEEGIKAADEGRIRPLTRELMSQLVEDGISRSEERK